MNKVVLLTGGQSEVSWYLIKEFKKKFPNSIVIVSNKINYSPIKNYLKFLIINLKNYFKKNILKQNIYNYTLPPLKKNFIIVDDINSQATVEILENFSPDIMCISGTKKVENYILNYAKISLNLHHGFIPNYRGVSSTDWVTYEKNFEYYYVTIHEAIEKLDAGKVFASKNILPYLNESYSSFKRRLLYEGAYLYLEVVKNINEYVSINQSVNIKSRNLKHIDKPKNFNKTVENNYNSIDSVLFRLNYASLREKIIYRIFNKKYSNNTNCKNGLYILNYHDFISESLEKVNTINVPSIYTEIYIFKSHIKYLKENFKILSLKDAIKKFLLGELVDNKYVVLTLDDGFKSNKEIVKYLAGENIRPTIFLNNNALLNNIPLINHKNYLITKYIQKYNKKYTEEYIKQYDLLIEGKNIDNEHFKLFINNSYLNIYDIEEIIDLCEIGSHTKLHSSLAGLDYKLQKNYIHSSHKQLEYNLDIKINYFSFPYGSNKDRDFISEYLAFDTADFVFSCNGGINKNNNIFGSFLRIGIHNEDIISFENHLQRQFVR
ncbi:polysaccharide deacetylase family protein [Sulfurimonas sp.]